MLISRLPHKPLSSQSGKELAPAYPVRGSGVASGASEPFSPRYPHPPTSPAVCPRASHDCRRLPFSIRRSLIGSRPPANPAAAARFALSSSCRSWRRCSGRPATSLPPLGLAPATNRPCYRRRARRAWPPRLPRLPRPSPAPVRCRLSSASGPVLRPQIPSPAPIRRAWPPPPAGPARARRAWPLPPAAPARLPPPSFNLRRARRAWPLLPAAPARLPATDDAPLGSAPAAGHPCPPPELKC